MPEEWRGDEEGDSLGGLRRLANSLGPRVCLLAFGAALGQILALDGGRRTERACRTGVSQELLQLGINDAGLGKSGEVVGIGDDPRLYVRDPPACSPEHLVWTVQPLLVIDEEQRRHGNRREAPPGVDPGKNAVCHAP